MKLLLAFIGGFFGSLTLFGLGVVAAILFLTADPVPVRTANQDVAQLWSAEARRIDPAAQDLERVTVTLDPSGAENRVTQDAADAEPPHPAVDAVTTAAVAGERPDRQATRRTQIEAAHLEWCANRYRSYRAEDDSYRPYAGGRRRCVSPYVDSLYGFMDTGARPAAGGADDDEEYVTADAYAEEEASFALTPEHIAHCFSRYRSYRPSDNSYQPYGGGPRQQCL